MTTNLMPDDRRSLTMRLSVLQGGVAAAFALLAVGFWIFQIAQHEKFREMAENNQQRRLPLPAPRGVLLDRAGKVLVENQDTRNIALVREQT
jgi:penicillin-binding protein 2